MKSFEKHVEELKYLEDLGFEVNPYTIRTKSLKTVWKKALELLNNKENLGYPVDGLVVKLNNNLLLEELGIVGKTYRGWCALKSHQQEVSTKLLGVSWQVGRTGKLTPVAELEPIDLDGTIVKRATLHNYKEVLEKDLRIGDWLIVHKAGDIIPEVVKVLDNLRIENNKKINIIQNCPSCHTKLIKSETGVDLYCLNTSDCREQIILRLSYFASRDQANIDGLSKKIIEKFVDLYGVRDFVDLYDLPWDEIVRLEGFGMKSVNNLKSAIDKTRNISAERFLSSLGIDGVGKEVSKLIIENLN